MSKEELVCAAVRIADERGLESVSIRRVADHVNISPMAVYRHVRDRDALLDEMARHVTRMQSLITAEGDGVAQLAAHYAHSVFGLLCTRPWLLQMVVHPQRIHELIPQEDMQAVLAALSADGLSNRVSQDLVISLSALAVGSASFAVKDDACRDSVVSAFELSLRATIGAVIEGLPREWVNSVVWEPAR